MNIITRWLLPIFFCVSLLSCANNTDLLHQSKNTSLPSNIGIQGYSPVSYFEHNRAELGNREFSVKYQKRIYYFTSSEQAEKFKEEPKKYTPKYGEYCPYHLALGRRVSIDPTNFKLQDGELLLFHDSVELNSIDVAAQSVIFEQADKQFQLLNF